MTENLICVITNTSQNTLITEIIRTSSQSGIAVIQGITRTDNIPSTITGGCIREIRNKENKENNEIRENTKRVGETNKNLSEGSACRGIFIG